jgi:hypothetical protein
VLTRDAQGLAKLPRAIGQIDGAPGGLPAAAHQIDSVERLERPNEDGAWLVDSPRNGVHAPVHAVDEIHVGDAGRTVERRRTLRPACSGVTGEIVLADIRLGFDDASRGRTVRRATLENRPE